MAERRLLACDVCKATEECPALGYPSAWGSVTLPVEEAVLVRWEKGETVHNLGPVTICPRCVKVVAAVLGALEVPSAALIAERQRERDAAVALEVARGRLNAAASMVLSSSRRKLSVLRTLGVALREVNEAKDALARATADRVKAEVRR